MSAIHTAMVNIAKEIAAEGIGKTRDNKQQGYKFRGVDEVMNAFAPVLAKHGVFVRPKFSNRTVVERSTKSGTALFYVTVDGEFKFTHESGEETDVGPFFGEAMDSGDKATNKAMAVAFKYAMFQTFCVPLEGVTGGDADSTTHEVTHIPAGRPRDGAWDSFGDDEKAFLQEIGAKVNEIIASGDTEAAHDYLASQNLVSEEKIAIWTLLDSKARSALKRVEAAKKTTKEAA